MSNFEILRFIFWNLIIFTHGDVWRLLDRGGLGEVLEGDMICVVFCRVGPFEMAFCIIRCRLLSGFVVFCRDLSPRSKFS